MKVKLTLYDVPQNLETILIDNTRAISPALEIKSSSGTMIIKGQASFEEVNEIVDTIKEFHKGDHALQTSY